jgi:molecular chaperone DnaK
MVKDAEANAEEDKKQLELVNARNHADALVHSVKKSIAEYGDKLDAEEKTKIEDALKAAEEVLKSATATKDDLEAKTEALLAASQKMGEKMYADAQAASAANAATAGAEPQKAADDNVVDAEFKEVKRG